MAIPAAAVAKAAAMLLTNEKTRKGLGWILVAIFSPVILLIALLCSLGSGGAEHFVGILGNLTAEISQVQEVISIHEQEAALFQCSHRMAHTWLRHLQVSGHIRRPHHALFLLENKDGLQIVLPGRMKFHGTVPLQSIKQCSSPLPARGW